MRHRPLTFARLITSALLISLAVSCGGAAGREGVPGTAGLTTVLDSTSAPDSVIARTAGTVDPSMVRSVVDELRIAPMADDTSLFAEVSEFDVGRDGSLFVYDRAVNVLFLFDSSGSVLRRIGRQGAGPGEFKSNNGMVVGPDGRLSQWDAANGRISLFSGDGELISSSLLASNFFMSNALRTDRSGTVLLLHPVTEPREGEILGRFGLVRLKDGGAFGDSLIPPDLPVGHILYVAESATGSSASMPTHSARFLFEWHPRGYFASADAGKYEIELSRPESLGGPLRIVRDAEAVPVPDEERDWDRARITFQMRRSVPGWTWRGPPIPNTKPPLAALHIGRDGSIWAGVAMPSERIPDAELEPQRKNARPRAIFRDAIAFEVFGDDGRFRGRVSLPPRSTFMEADGNQVWYLQRDEDGLPAVVRARVEPAFPPRDAHDSRGAE